MLAQDFHDLTGQVVAKVVALANDLEGSLLKLLMQVVPADQVHKVEQRCCRGRWSTPKGAPTWSATRARSTTCSPRWASEPGVRPAAGRALCPAPVVEGNTAPNRRFIRLKFRRLPAPWRSSRSSWTRARFAMADAAQDRRLPATERKIRKAREDGQVARSRDLGHFVAFGAGGALMVALARPLTDWLSRCSARACASTRSAVADPAAMTQRLADARRCRCWPSSCRWAWCWRLVALAASVLSGGWNFTLKPLQPKFDKLNPLTGLGRMFSKQQLVDDAEGLRLALVLGGVGACYLQGHCERLRAAAGACRCRRRWPAPAASLLGGLLLVVLVLALFALVDVPLQRCLLAEQLKMSHQEVKQEHKEVEGNAEIKGKMQRPHARRWPTPHAGRGAAGRPRGHEPDPLRGGAEVRRGRHGRAARGGQGRRPAGAAHPRRWRSDAKVPVLQAPPLARALYAHCEVDREIPAALFAAVAQVLAWVFQLRAALAAGRRRCPARRRRAERAARARPAEHEPRRAELTR